MRLASGICPSIDLTDAGALFGLGVDGSASNDASNMILEARQALYIQRLRYGAEKITPERVLAVDYKSNAVVPATAAGVPEGLLRQMAAYRAALAQLWPGLRVETAVLWTATRSLMALPDAVLDRAMAGAMAAGLDPVPLGA